VLAVLEHDVRGASIEVRVEHIDNVLVVDLVVEDGVLVPEPLQRVAVELDELFHSDVLAALLVEGEAHATEPAAGQGPKNAITTVH
jgi:hypothetical protein